MYMKDLFSTPQPDEIFKESLKQEFLREYRATMNSGLQENWLQKIISSGFGLSGIAISGVSFVLILFLVVSVSDMPLNNRENSGANQPNVDQQAEVAFEDYEKELSDISMLLQNDSDLDAAINFEIL